MPRLDVAVLSREGKAQIVNAARPASLVAFSDAHDGKIMPESPREIAWVVHHALGITEPLAEWLNTLEDISAMPRDVRRARKIMAGDTHERDVWLGVEEDETGGLAQEAQDSLEAGDVPPFLAEQMERSPVTSGGS